MEYYPTIDAIFDSYSSCPVDMPNLIVTFVHSPLYFRITGGVSTNKDIFKDIPSEYLKFMYGDTMSRCIFRKLLDSLQFELKFSDPNPDSCHWCEVIISTSKIFVLSYEGKKNDYCVIFLSSLILWPISHNKDEISITFNGDYQKLTPNASCNSLDYQGNFISYIGII